MNTEWKKEDNLIQNLRDSGCSQSSIEQFMNSYKERNVNFQINILSKHRAFLLKSLHEIQYKIDCLDYLIFNIKQQAHDL